MADRSGENRDPPADDTAHLADLTAEEMADLGDCIDLVIPE